MADPNDLPVNIDATYPDVPARPDRKVHQQHHDIIHQVLRDHETAIDALESSPGGVSSVDGDTGAVDLSGSYVPLAGNATINGLKDFTTAPTVNGSPIAGDVSDADADTKGVLQLAGDLGGSAAAPTVPGLVLKLDITDAAVISSDTPLVAFGSGSAGASGTASDGAHVHPAQPFEPPQPFVLTAGAIDQPALVISAISGQISPIVQWTDEDGNVQCGVGAGVVDVSDGFGFPQITGFPRFRGQAYSSYGLVKCSGAFWVEQNSFLVGQNPTQANYNNTGFSLSGGDVNVVPYSSGASARLNMNAGGGWVMPSCWVTSDVIFGKRGSDAPGYDDLATVYCRDNGSGKDQLVVRFGSGAVQVLATEP